MRAKFGIGVPAVGFGPGARGGGGGGGARLARNVMARIGTVKGAIMGVWETPSDALMKQVAEVQAAVPAAIREANAFLAKVRPMSQLLLAVRRGA